MIFSCAFPIRQYECDALGHLNNVTYVRLMQEAALLASAHVGWTTTRYTDMGTNWLVRETTIEYLQPVRYGDTLTVKTWVEDFRRVRSWRNYEFWVGDTLCARASTDWVYVETATGKPLTIPPDMIRDYRPDGGAKMGDARAKFPALPPRPTEVFTLDKRVEFRDIDLMGHANNATYFAYCEDVGMQVGKHFGWSIGRMLSEGVAMVLREFRIQYLAPALLDETVRLETYLSDPKRATIYRHYQVTRPADNQALAQARGYIVFIDLKTNRPLRFPQSMMDAFAPNCSP